MKKNVLMTVFLIVLASIPLMGLFIYSNQSEDKVAANEKSGIERQDSEKVSKKDVREVAWEQLASEQKELVDGSWESGKVSKVTLQGVLMIGVEDKSYEGKEIYMIEFPTDPEKTINGMSVLVDKDSFDLIGFAPQD